MQYINKNEYNSFTFTLTECNGDPVDLSESTVKFIVKKDNQTEDSNAVMTGTIANSDTNIIMFEFNATESNILEGQYVGALKIFKTGGINKEVWSDKFTVVKGVFDE